VAERPRHLGAAAAAAVFAATAALAQPASGPTVDAPGKLPGPPPSAVDRAYDERLLSSAEAAESFQGPLDGAWTLRAEGRGDLYAFELTDKGDHVEGAWRDLRRPRDPVASGFLEEARRARGGLRLRFTPPGQPPVNVALGPNLRGQAEQDGRSLAVTLLRSPP
jgi:hypothetical protein